MFSFDPNSLDIEFVETGGELTDITGYQIFLMNRYWTKIFSPMVSHKPIDHIIHEKYRDPVFQAILDEILYDD